MITLSTPRFRLACLVATLLLALMQAASADDHVPGVSTDDDAPAPRGQCFLTCNPDIVVNTNPGLCGATVTFAAPVSSPCVTTELCTPASGSFFDTGVTTVNCQASSSVNPGMIVATCSFKITVKDVEPPALMCPPPDSITAQVDNTGKAAVPDVMFQTSLSENCAAGASVVSQDPAPGTKVDPGTVNITVFGKDVAGNTGTCTYALRVNKADCGGGMCGTGVAPAIVGAMLLTPLGRAAPSKRRRR